jgi:alkylation response protein AidB-like acyl-CoA dehydrogenase
MDADDLVLFERSLQHATENFSADALDSALTELGWEDALAIDADAAVSTLFELQGRANVTSSAIATVVLAAVAPDRNTDTAVVFPSVGTWTSPGIVEDGNVTVRGIAAASALDRSTALVVAPAGDALVAVSASTAELSLRTVHGLDPSLGLVEVTGGARIVEELGAVVWSRAIRGAHLAISHELIGASRTMLDLARQHALERIQFGVPISSFQAVRHRLAEAFVSIEAAEAMTRAAWDDGEDATAAMAKAVAGRAARTTARHSQQVLAGIGFTLEHPFHAYFRRILVLDELFGSARALTRQLGEDTIRTRRLPPVLPL